MPLYCKGTAIPGGSRLDLPRDAASLFCFVAAGRASSFSPHGAVLSHTGFPPNTAMQEAFQRSWPNTVIKGSLSLVSHCRQSCHITLHIKLSCSVSDAVWFLADCPKHREVSEYQSSVVTKLHTWNDILKAIKVVQIQHTQQTEKHRKLSCALGCLRVWWKKGLNPHWRSESIKLQEAIVNQMSRIYQRPFQQVFLQHHLYLR